MATKMTGAQFVAFWNDPEIWENGAVLSDETVSADGVEIVDADDISESAKSVVISSGYIDGGNYDGESFENVAKKWVKKQKTKSFVVECDAAIFDAVSLAVKNSGGKIR